MAADGSDVQVLTDQIDEVAVAPPVWSPDGERLAFVVNEGELYLTEDRSVYTVRADGSELVKIGQATIPPTWSPDSRHLAFATNDRHTNDGQESTIHTARFDGTDLRPVPVSQLGDARLSISQISWSPDGSELLIVSNHGVHTLAPDGSDLRKLADAGKFDRSNYAWPTVAAWSSDRSRIAVYYPEAPGYPDDGNPGGQLVTIARDGTDLRIIAERDAGGGFKASRPSRPETSVNLEKLHSVSVVQESLLPSVPPKGQRRRWVSYKTVHAGSLHIT